MGLLSLITGASFRHGIHPPGMKETTRGLPIRRLPFAPRFVIPLSQHFGNPSVPLVKKGQEVVRGEPIAGADGYMSVPMHSPVTGVVEGIELMASARGPKVQSIIIRGYPSASQQVLYERPCDVGAMKSEELIQAIQDIGMVGLGGAAFPTHVKLDVPVDKRVDTLVVNGCECEPYLTTDHRIMIEQTDALLAGIRIAMRATRAERAIIGVEDDKPEAVAAIRARLGPGDTEVTVVPLRTIYPQGSEKMLIKSLLGREVPSGRFPYDVGVVVNNVGTLAGIGALLPLGRGLIERVITVAGPGVARPGNYLTPIGTPLRYLLEHVGYTGDAGRVILGGPMMGNAVASLDVPVTKGASGVLVMPEEAKEEEEEHLPIMPCIRCGRCLSACPVNLNPCEMGRFAAKREYEIMAERFHLNDCFECGCCSYVCPSNIPLVQYFRIAKSINRERAA